MNALKTVVLILTALAIFGCAGAARKQILCIEMAMDYHVKEVKYIQTFDYGPEDEIDMIHDSTWFSQMMIRSCLNR